MPGGGLFFGTFRIFRTYNKPRGEQGMLIVQKYGGTSLADGKRIQGAALRVAGLQRQGHQVVVVVSALGQLTDDMIARAREVNIRGAAREMDAYLAAGEQMSAGLMAMAIGALGCPAVSLTGWQAGIRTDKTFGAARIETVDTGRIRKELARGKAVVVAGFQGVSEAGDVTTLGRGGSDTTAVALAVALGADRCQIFTDVDGIYDRDPRKYPQAIRFGRISYEKMMRLIENGAQVLHGPCVQIAQQAQLPIEVLSAFTGAPGTIVSALE